jgi:hypothetical protein
MGNEAESKMFSFIFIRAQFEPKTLQKVAKYW